MSKVTQSLQSHVSIRNYKSDPIPENILNDVLESGLRGSSSGNMQTWSVIVTKDLELRKKLHPIHMRQDMILQAPVTLTFCADFGRMMRWIDLRQAPRSFDDLIGFIVAASDAFIAAQNMAIAAESHGLGICYMGTTLWAADEIAELMKLPKFVIPVTSMVMGYPNEAPSKRDRLALSTVVHQETYRQDSDEQILQQYQKREVDGWNRYMSFPGMKEEFEKAGIKNLAHFYTSEIKYGKEIHRESSIKFLELLKKQGYWNF